MSTLIFTLLAALGLDYVVVEGSIFGFVRGRLLAISNRNGDKGFATWLLDLITCTQCFGFWSGAIVEALSCTFRHPLAGPVWISIPLTGFAVSGLAVIIRKIGRE